MSLVSRWPGGDSVLPADAMAAVDACMGPHGGLGSVEPLVLPKLVSDHAAKFVVRRGDGRRAAVVVVSPPCDPEGAARAATRALAARRLLGEALGACVLTPWHVGRSGDVAFSITAYGRPLRGLWSRWRIGAAALRWLADATKATTRPVTDGDRDAFAAEPLRRLARHPALGPVERRAAAHAVAALDAGEWQPCTVLAHDDLWYGNLLHAPKDHDGRAPFVVIDWAGSRADGCPAYDLVRLARSLRLRPASLAEQLVAHARVLQCPPSHMRHHLMAASAQLADHLGEWPESLFAETVTDCLRTLDEALATRR